jgi:arylsulfatase A-like enzyme
MHPRQLLGQPGINLALFDCSVGRFVKLCGDEEAVPAALMMRLPGVIAPGRSTGALVELIDILPTLLDLCGVETPANVQGRSLRPLLRGTTGDHREHVIAEHADNAEAMVRTDRWKLVHSAGHRQRRDGYALDSSPSGRSTRLYDLADDGREMNDVADRPESRAFVEGLAAILAEHSRNTDRDADTVPTAGDARPILDRGLLPDEDRR